TSPMKKVMDFPSTPPYIAHNSGNESPRLFMSEPDMTGTVRICSAFQGKVNPNGTPVEKHWTPQVACLDSTTENALIWVTPTKSLTPIPAVISQPAGSPVANAFQ